jgi:acylphosphatase
MAERQLHAIVRGRVQMVGFRYFVVNRARELRLTGWVRNGDDGVTVEVVAEGPEASLRELEAALRRGPEGSRVDDVATTWSDALGKFTHFEPPL